MRNGIDFFRVGTASAVAGLLVVIAGCGQKNFPGPPKTYPVTGKVTLANGEPACGGGVHFEDAGAGLTKGRGRIGNDGTFSASAFPRQVGLQPGDYKVWIEPHSEGTYGRIDGTPTPVPAKYQNADTSGLTLTVKKEENTYNIELK